MSVKDPLPFFWLRGKQRNSQYRDGDLFWWGEA